MVAQPALIYGRADGPFVLLRSFDDFGLPALDLGRPPRRFWGDASVVPPAVELNVDARRAQPQPSPAALLERLPPGDNWQAMTRRSVNRAFAWFLVVEDPQRRLEAQPIVTLAHQASLVHHVLQEPSLRRVLIADEVGLGKTVEAALIIKDLLVREPGLRVLYLAPARLVSNVRREFERMALGFRTWVSGQERDGTLKDNRLIASIHRASHPAHFASVVDSGPWDVIVVDECHHLSDWQPEGGKPVQKYRLVNELQQRLGPAQRLILLSGTPHQGHQARFQNVLALLRGPGEPETAIAGRVIYRTKEHVADWDGSPLFPNRQVNPPHVADLGPDHRNWLQHIHDFFEPTAPGSKVGQAQQRAVGWRCGQALQWATSSIQAGLGYLVRQAIRAGWTNEQDELNEAVAALRPYRGGRKDEPISALLARISREVAIQRDVDDVEDIEDEQDGPEANTRWQPNAGQLASLLREGVALLRTSANAKWEFLEEKVLQGAGAEKVVLFAQPIETVTALADFLEAKTGKRPALIIGMQSDEERKREIDAFWRDDGPQFLVSSRAGGEGLNLQIARRLVHVDVPWNPMELEQRVGRVHRFLSKRTILVDTIVVRDSREVHTYRAAREKLQEISGSLVQEGEFESLFARVMSLVPPEELQSVLGERPLGPLNSDEAHRISALVAQGYERWSQFHNRYSDQRQNIRALNPGQCHWSDLARFARDQLDARPAEGFSALRFRWSEGQAVEASESAQVLRIGEDCYACGDYNGSPVTGDHGAKAKSFGLNVEAVSQALRRVGLTETPAGAAHLRWPEGRELPLPDLARPFGVLLSARMTYLANGSAYDEGGSELHGVVVTRDGETRSLPPGLRAPLIRALLDGVVRREPEDAPDLLGHLARAEAELVGSLRRPTDEDRAKRLVHACIPLLAAVVS